MPYLPCDHNQCQRQLAGLHAIQIFAVLALFQKYEQNNHPRSHGDHTAYLNDILDEYPNAKFIGYKNLIHKSNKYEFYPVNDQDRVLLGKINIKIIHTPGHFPDSLCYLMENIIFTGDTLFVGRTGRTISANASTKDLYYSIYDKILSLPGNTLIYPGAKRYQIQFQRMERLLLISKLQHLISQII